MSALRHVVTLAICAAFVLPAESAARDPMRPPQPMASRSAGHAETPVLLSAVIGIGERRVAIVNGRVFRAGESFDGITVERIAADAVVYRRGGVLRELKLAAAPSVKRPADLAGASSIRIKAPAATERGPAGEQ